MLDVTPNLSERRKESEVKRGRFVAPKTAGMPPIYQMQEDNQRRDQQRGDPFELPNRGLARSNCFPRTFHSSPS
jgi:hypothetical protein